jgi:hypothetical protein
MSPSRAPLSQLSQPGSIKERRAQAGREQAGEASGILHLADKDTDSDVVSKVLKTAGRAGFVNVRFGVIPQ